MSTNTTNLSLKKAADADNARTYLETDLGGSLDTLDGLFARGTAADRPTAGTEGRFYLATDTDVLSFDDGAAWHMIATLTGTETLTNKTLTSPSMTTPTVSSGGLNVSAASDDDGIRGKSGSTVIFDLTRESNDVKLESFANVQIWQGSGGTTGSGTLSATFGPGLQVGSPTGTDKGAGTINVATGYYVNGGKIGDTLTNSLSANVDLDNTGNYIDGPSVAQGTSGTWWCAGSVTLTDSVSNADFYVELTDGTTVIASAAARLSATNTGLVVALSGRIVSPASDIRIRVRDTSSTSGTIVASTTGAGKDSTLTVMRIG